MCRKVGDVHEPVTLSARYVRTDTGGNMPNVLNLPQGADEQGVCCACLDKMMIHDPGNFLLQPLVGEKVGYSHHASVLHLFILAFSPEDYEEELAKRPS